MVTYGTSAIPSDQINVLAGGTVAVSVAFENTVGLMGGMDTSNGSATPGDVVKVNSPPDAATKFGDGSELHEQVKLAFNNGAGEIWALPVQETTVSAETQSSQSGTLDNAPAFDPRVNDEHSITVADSGGTDPDVVLVDEPPSSAPTDAETIEIYPPTGDYYADAAPTGSNYEFDYAYGDYSTSAMTPLLDKSPRMVGVLTENETVMTDLATELNSRATNFDFMHGVGGAKVSVTPSGYSDSLDERRLSLVYPSRGWIDSSETNEQRTVGAIAGYLAGLALGLSSTNDSIGGFAGGLKNDLAGPAEAGTLIDNQVMPLLDYPPVTIAKDMTTSTEPKFERVYAMQVIDEATEISHTISRNFVGDQNTESNRQNLRRSHQNAFIDMRDGAPPLLSDFTVSVSQNDADPNQTDVAIGLEVVGIMDLIDVTMTVGDIVRNGGAS